MPFKENFNPSYKPSQRIETENNKERPKTKLEQLMINISKETKESLGEDLLDERGAIIMDRFQEEHDGPYDIETKTHDELHVANKKLEFSGAYNFPVGYKRNKRLEAWEKSKSESKPEQVEMAMTGVLYKALNEHFLVARASTFDDYENGIDNVIVNRLTGDVVCAFDEVHDKDDSARIKEKDEKIIKHAKHGGARLKYGLSFHRKYHSLIKMPLDNIPVFYLAMDNEHLSALLADNSSDTKQITKTETSTFANIVDSLELQYQTLLAQPNLPEKIQKNLDKFTESLEIMKAIKANILNLTN